MVWLNKVTYTNCSPWALPIWVTDRKKQESSCVVTDNGYTEGKKWPLMVTIKR